MKTARVFRWSLLALLCLGLLAGGGFYWHFRQERNAGVQFVSEGRRALANQQIAKRRTPFSENTSPVIQMPGGAVAGDGSGGVTRTALAGTVTVEDFVNRL
ncbi:MAG: hypothetical protein ACR2HH_01570 [Chthoniobacterales bacterium]